MTIPEVGYERRGGLGLIRLQRPQALNAFTLKMIEEIERLARAAERDADVAALCITGEGRAFCAGLDMSALQDSVGEALSTPAADDGGSSPALFSFLLEISKPVIAAVNGVTAGGGFVLAMMCDLRFFSEAATVTTVFSRRGLIAEHGTSWLLPRMIGLSRALDLLWSSRTVDAAEAHRIGFADRLVPKDALLEAVSSYVADLAATVSPRALAVMKRQVHRHLSMPFDEAARDSRRLMVEALGRADALEGAASFVERRAPRFAPWAGEEA